MSVNPLRITLSLLVFIALWEAVVALAGLPSWMLPRPSEIFLEFVQDYQGYLYQAGSTLATTLAGFGLAFIFGPLLAVLIVYSRLFEASVFPLLISFNSIPKIALAPLFVIWLGTGAQARISVSFLIAFFPVVIDTMLGLRSVDPDALDLFRTMRGSRFQALLKIRLPHALPYLFSGLKVAISFALVGAIAGEFIASQTGLGSAILVAQGMFQTQRVFVSLILLGLMGAVLFYAVEFAERIVCPWHVSHRTAIRA
jgi:NitT/TauT family transport system permease protein